MADSTDQVPEDEPVTGPGFSIRRSHLLIALGVLGVCALVLASARKRVESAEQTLSGFSPGPDLAESLRHLAGVVELRTAGLSDRLDTLERQVRELRGDPEPVYAQPLGVADDGTASGPPISVATHPPVGAEEPPPPGPASVSLP